MIPPSPLKSLRPPPGYIPEEILMPDWLTGNVIWDTVGDVMWLGSGDWGKEMTIGSFDTLSGQWQQLELDTGDARHPSLRSMSVCPDALWGLVQENGSEEQVNAGTVPEDLGYYVLHVDLKDGGMSCTRIGFDVDSSTESSELFFFSILALDGDRALLGSQSLYVIDPEANMLSQLERPDYGALISFKVDGQRYLLTATDTFAPFDVDSQSVGQSVTVPTDSYTDICMSSNNGHFLCEKNMAICLLDGATGEARELFKRIDVALSYGSMNGSGVFENSKGEFFFSVDDYMNNGVGCIVKVTEGMVPVKKPLTLACFAEINAETSPYRLAEYDYTVALMDAVIRFNNTDPEYKISVKSLRYETEAERDRLLIDLATSDDAERLREQVYSTEKLAIYDEQIFAVISSEAKAYFAGQKTAEETASQIQSRISLYLAEQG